MKVEDECTPGPSIERRYTMTKKQSGNVYVFNHAVFDDGSLRERPVALRDLRRISWTFTRLKFDVIAYNDLNYSEILQKLSDIAEIDHSNFDCIVIFVLTHGRNGKVLAKDVDYYPDVYWNKLNESSSLSSKPKLIFVQAPRGDEAGEVNNREPEPTTTFPIPTVPDVLVMYSSYDEFFSWQSRVTGSWFIFNLCRELYQNAKSTDVLSQLTSLNLKLMLDPQCWTRKIFTNFGKDIGTVVSTLTKLLYFELENK